MMNFGASTQMKSARGRDSALNGNNDSNLDQSLDN